MNQIIANATDDILMVTISEWPLVGDHMNSNDRSSSAPTLADYLFAKSTRCKYINVEIFGTPVQFPE